MYNDIMTIETAFWLAVLLFSRGTLCVWELLYICLAVCFEEFQLAVNRGRSSYHTGHQCVESRRYCNYQDELMM